MRRPGKILATAAAVAIAAVLVLGSIRPAHASGPGWKVQTTVTPSGSQSSTLQAVRCASASACIAVGSYTNGTGTPLTLAERWNGTGWVMTTTPNPAGATSSGLQAVSCTSASACTAVGSYKNTVGTILTLVERWNGTSWTIQSTPNPSGATKSGLLGAACTSSTACAAVGFYVNSSNTTLTLALGWNGSAWSIKPSPNPGGTTVSKLLAVSCGSATSCVAVGSYNSSLSTQAALSEHWNGSTWSLLATPNVSGAALNALQGVACPTATACIAVGYAGSAPTATATLAEHLSGTVWTIKPTPNDGSDDPLDAISCTSKTACTAVGGIGGRVSAPPPLAEVWDGSLWVTLTAVASPSAVGPSLLTGVSCTSPTVCTGVGFYSLGSGRFATLAEGGASWIPATTVDPAGAVATQLNGISCASSTACVAVGFYNSGSGPQLTLAERWSGSKWSTLSTPNPSGATQSFLQSVSCSSASACTAVGGYQNSSTGFSLAERWNGTSWTIQGTSSPGGTPTLNGVSCPSSTTCLAVGSYYSTTFQLPYALRWNGSTWSYMSVPTPSGAQYTILQGVSCASTTACTAVGVSFNGSSVASALAERWDGTSWTIEAGTVPSGATQSDLNGVSCRSTTSCIAVGTYNTGSTLPSPLAESWNGTTWTILSAAAPSDADDTFLQGVSCSASNACSAVGYDLNTANTDVTLIETWNGVAWSVQPSPNPDGAQSVLAAVSCVSSKVCSAVGNYNDSSSTEHSLNLR
jgi:hypothetical protein